MWVRDGSLRKGNDKVVAEFEFRGMPITKGHIMLTFDECTITSNQFTSRNLKGEPVTGTVAIKFTGHERDPSMEITFTQTYPTAAKFAWAGWRG